MMIIITFLACVATAYKWMFTGFEAHVPVKFSVCVCTGYTLGCKEKNYMEEYCHHMSKHSEHIPVCDCITPSEKRNEG